MPGLEEDLSDSGFGAAVGGEGLNVERFDGWVEAFGNVVHEGFGGDGFAVLEGSQSGEVGEGGSTYSRWPVEDDASL